MEQINNDGTTAVLEDPSKTDTLEELKKEIEKTFGPIARGEITPHYPEEKAHAIEICSKVLELKGSFPSKKGFTLIELLAVLAFVGVVGFGIWYFFA